MKFNLRQAVASLFHLFTGLGKSVALPAETEAAAAVFLPLLGLLAGLLAALAAFIFLSFLPSAAGAVAGLAVLAALGGYARMRAVAGLFGAETRAAGIAVFSLLVLLFEVFVLTELANNPGTFTIYPVLIYMPVVSAVAMLSAASAMKADDSRGISLSGVKGWHMLLASLLAFVLMLPGFWLSALAFAATSVLAGALTALTMRNSRNKEAAAFLAAIVSELLFLIVLMILRGRPVIYY